MTSLLLVMILLLFPTRSLGAVSWIFSCGQQALLQDWIGDQPMDGSVSQELVKCMVDRVMTSPFTTEELRLLPPSTTGSDWCLPDDFLSGNRTCTSLRFDIFEPIRYCIEEENFPDLSSDAEYYQGFNNTSSPFLPVQSSFYLSTRLANSMCALLDALRSNLGRECLVEVCRQASHSPSQEPSSPPSIAPSSAPSRIPSASPSGVPSETPTTFPSPVPSEGPSLQPSASPSSYPTREASEVPSAYPTVETLAPSAAPSAPPSWYPTPAPTSTRPWGPGPFLEVKITLRVLLDGVSPNEVPLPDPTNHALERALTDSVRSVQGFQKVDIVSATKAPVPRHAPIVLNFRISAKRTCDDGQIACEDPFVPAKIAREFRDAFAESVQTGSFASATRRQAFRRNVTSLTGLSPRPNSSNLMSSNSIVVRRQGDKLLSSGSIVATRFVGSLLLSIFLSSTLLMALH